METEFSADFKTAIYDLGEAVTEVMSKLPSEDPNAKATIGHQLRIASRVIGEIMHEVRPEISSMVCGSCKKYFLVEPQFWSGECPFCGATK